MSTKATCVDVRLANGTLLLTACIYEKEVVPDEKGSTTSTHDTVPERQTDRKTEPTDGRNSARPSPDKAPAKGKTDQALMTDAQKRFLFRLLAERGIEGDKAQDHLKNLLHVSSLKQVTKLEASRAIEELLEKQNGGAGHDRPPF